MTSARGPRKATMIATPPISAKAAATALLRHRCCPGLSGLDGPFWSNVTWTRSPTARQFATRIMRWREARKMIAEGADIIDIGARIHPAYGGSQPVSAEERGEAVASGAPDLVALGVPVSIDSMKSEVVA